MTTDKKVTDMAEKVIEYGSQQLGLSLTELERVLYEAHLEVVALNIERLEAKE